MAIVVACINQDVIISSLGHHDRVSFLCSVFALANVPSGVTMVVRFAFCPKCLSNSVYMMHSVVSFWGDRAKRKRDSASEDGHRKSKLILILGHRQHQPATKPAITLLSEAEATQQAVVKRMRPS